MSETERKSQKEEFTIKHYGSRLDVMNSGDLKSKMLNFEDDTIILFDDSEEVVINLK